MNLNDKLNLSHESFFKTTQREVFFYGGAGAGKSYSVADKILIQPSAQERKIKALVVRKTLPSLRRTCIPLIEQRAELFNINYSLNKTDFKAVYNGNSEIHYVSMNNRADYEKVKSITDVDIIWIEELNELSREAFDLLKLRLRGGLGLYKQLIGTFNPIGTTSWVYDYLFVEKNKAKAIHTTVYDNPFIDKEYIQALEALKDTNSNLYKIYCRGEFGDIEGAIYSKYKVVESLPDKKIDDIFYGLDFGFNNPTALVKIYMIDGVPYLGELIYESKLTNQDLIKKMKGLNIGREIIYCDSAEPNRIKELRDEGFRARDSNKSVIDGIDFVKNLELNILEGSENIIKEIASYSYEKNIDGKFLEIPVKFKDHLMDAIRYGLYTHLAHKFNFVAVGPDGIKIP